MSDKPNIPGTPGFRERRSGHDRRHAYDRRGGLRWDPSSRERRSGKDRRRPASPASDETE